MFSTMALIVFASDTGTVLVAAGIILKSLATIGRVLLQ